MKSLFVKYSIQSQCLTIIQTGPKFRLKLAEAVTQSKTDYFN